jgi:hypothetical protein
VARTWSRTSLDWRSDCLFIGGRASKWRIMKDEKYSMMWRIQRPDGTFTDMLNRTRAKETAESLALGDLNLGN